LEKVKKSIRANKLRLMVSIVVVIVLFVFMAWNLRTMILYQTISPETFSTFQQWKDASLFFSLMSIPFIVFVILIGLSLVDLFKLQRKECSIAITDYEKALEKEENPK